MAFSRNFLTDIAQEKELSPRERDVFLALLGDDKSRPQIAEMLHLSPSAVSTCLTGIYRKFQIADSGPVKESRLKDYLTNRYRRLKSENSEDSSIIDSGELSIDALVREVRSRAHADTKERTGTMQMLRVNDPVPVTDIYVDLNILKRVSSDLSFSDWSKEFEFDWRGFDRLGLGQVEQERVPAIEKIRDCRKLMVLGKPGAGKTTLLKSLATACIERDLEWDELEYVPVFITLREFAEDAAEEEKFSLCAAIQQQFDRWGVTEAAEPILKQGRTLILLDGLDEVPTRQSEFVVRQMRRFCQNYGDNRLIITCRTQSLKFRFEGFTNVEIADLTPEQVARFIQKWFAVVVGNAEAVELAERLIWQLQENEPIAELAVTPILLNLTCSVFWDERGKLPAKRAELYEKGLKDLLQRLARPEALEEEDLFKRLTSDDKENLLAQVAYTLFEENDYFPKQRKLERLIVEHLKHIKIRRSEAEQVLRSLEAQHGLIIERSEGRFSFSHLTFQEYFTAKYIVDSSTPEVAFQHLVTHITEPRWREVFLLTVSMVENAHELLVLMKQKQEEIGTSLILDKQLKKFLGWVNTKASSVKVSYKFSEKCNFYFALVHDFPLARYVAGELGSKPDIQGHDDNIFNYDVAYRHLYELYLDLSLTSTLYSENVEEFYRGLEGCRSDFIRTPKLHQALEHIKIRLPRIEEDFEKLLDEDWQREKRLVEETFWQANGQTRLNELRTVMIEHRNIGHDWQFSEKQKEQLKRYYDANKLLMDCLNSDCNASPEVKEEIEKTLLLPKRRD